MELVHPAHILHLSHSEMLQYWITPFQPPTFYIKNKEKTQNTGKCTLDNTYLISSFEGVGLLLHLKSGPGQDLRL